MSDRLAILFTGGDLVTDPAAARETLKFNPAYSDLLTIV
jgi:hypothetical protein